MTSIAIICVAAGLIVGSVIATVIVVAVYNQKDALFVRRWKAVEEEVQRQRAIGEWQHLEIYEMSFRLGWLYGMGGYSYSSAWTDCRIRKIVTEGKQKLTKPIKAE